MPTVSFSNSKGTTYTFSALTSEVRDYKSFSKIKIGNYFAYLATSNDTIDKVDSRETNIKFSKNGTTWYPIKLSNKLTYSLKTNVSSWTHTVTSSATLRFGISERIIVVAYDHNVPMSCCVFSGNSTTASMTNRGFYIERAEDYVYSRSYTVRVFREISKGTTYYSKDLKIVGNFGYWSYEPSSLDDHNYGYIATSSGGPKHTLFSGSSISADYQYINKDCSVDGGSKSVSGAEWKVIGGSQTRTGDFHFTYLSLYDSSRYQLLAEKKVTCNCSGNCYVTVVTGYDQYGVPQYDKKWKNLTKSTTGRFETAI